MRGSDGGVTNGGRLAALSRLAIEAGSPELARVVDALAERLREGRFYVACVGQFKRGKSTLVNALVGESVLPTGVVPITAAVTVVRHGERLAARVRFGERDWEECDPGSLATYVSEEQNPGNEKGVVAVEVFVPSPLLESGMCLVDTPGIGSISAANTAATREFVPHVDAALVVVGADPPISGDELALVQEIAREVADLIFVLNKADKLSDAEREQAIRFTERVLSERLGRRASPILQVSAAERLARAGPERDWNLLSQRLDSLARQSGADLVRAAEERGTAALVERLLGDLDEQEAALLRPLEESQARMEVLRRAVAQAEQSLEELGHRFTAVQERLYRAFTDERDRFFNQALPLAQRELQAALRAEPTAGPALRQRAIDHAIEVTKRWLDRWRQEQEPRVEALYRGAVERFVELLHGFQQTLASVSGVQGLPGPSVEAAFQTKSRFHYTDMLIVAPSSAPSRLLDLLRPGSQRVRAIERDTTAFLERLFEVNTARIKNDFQDRVVESRRRLEQETRDRLRELSASAERALERARQTQTAGSAAVRAKLEWLRGLRIEVQGLLPRRKP